MVRDVKIEPDSSGAIRSLELWTVDLLNNQKLLHGPINKIVLLTENEMVQFPTEEILTKGKMIQSLERNHV